MKKQLLSVGLWLLLASLALAQGLGIPTEIKPVSGYAGLKPKTEAKAITYIGMSGLDPLPTDFLADSRWFLVAVPKETPEGRYKFLAVGAFVDGEKVTQELQEFYVVVGDSPVVIDPTKPPVKPTDPVKPAPTDKPAAVAYVIERGTPQVPAISAAIDKLNMSGILATLVFASSTDGTGNTAVQYKAAIAAAKEAGLPAMVVSDKEYKVLKTVKSPKEKDFLDMIASPPPMAP